MNTRIVMVRHGETPYNVERKFQGSADIPLNDRGRSQAKFTMAALSNTHIDAIYSSPLVRAVETAEIIRSGRVLEVKRLGDLREMTVGDWEGFTIDEINSRYPEEYATWQNHPDMFRLEGADTLESVRDRTVAAIKAIAKENAGKTVLVVSHICSLSTAMLTFAGLPISKLWEHPVKNASINIIEFSDEGEISIIEWNKVDHILDEASPIVPIRETEQK